MCAQTPCSPRTAWWVVAQPPLPAPGLQIRLLRWTAQVGWDGSRMYGNLFCILVVEIQAHDV